MADEPDEGARRERSRSCRHERTVAHVIVPWLARITGYRARSDARLLLVVLAVAVVSCTLIASLALLVSVTEQGGLRTALGVGTTDRAQIDLTVASPTVAITDVKTAASSAVDFVLADSVPSTSTTIALSGLARVAGPADQKPILAYFGDLDDVATAATIVAGEWPAESGSGSGSGSGPIPVAVPEGAADALGLGVGSSFTSDGDAAEIVGVYRIDDADDDYWYPDPLGGAGIDRTFPLPGTRTFIATDAFGPAVVAPGTFDAGGLVVQSVDLRFRPDFRTVTVDDMGVLAERLDDARSRITARMGDVGERVSYSSALPDVVGEAASGLLVTRSTVITVGLLLLLVAIVSLAQSARLVTDSRIDERRLLRARGASLAGIRGMTAIEAAAIGLAAAVLSPVLASLVYRLIASHPAMVAAGMPPDAGLPPLVWGVAGGTSLVFVAVLLAPLVRPGELFDDERGEQRAGRRIRPLGFVRVGIDLGIAAIAVVLYQQLVAYRPPVGAASVRIDPLLVITPALLLGVCSLLAVRLVPAVATLLEWSVSRARGAVLSLAAWEVGRRARRATAAVLLLTLALAVGSFGSTFLSTWRQSQIDQVALAFGAPARVPADPALAATQQTVLAEGARGEPHPVLRRFGRVAGSNAIGSGTQAPSGPSALILGITQGGRTLIDRGRAGDEGGSFIERMLRSDIPDTTAIALPVSSRGLSLTVRIGAQGETFPGVVATVSAVVAAGSGPLTIVPLGQVPFDGTEYAVQGMWPGADGGDEFGRAGVAFSGLVVDFSVEDSEAFELRTAATLTTVFVKDLNAVSVTTAGDGSEVEESAGDGAAGERSAGDGRAGEPSARGGAEEGSEDAPVGDGAAGQESAGDGPAGDGSEGGSAEDGSAGDRSEEDGSAGDGSEDVSVGDGAAEEVSPEDGAAEVVSAAPVAIDALDEWVPRARTQYDTDPAVIDPPDGWQLALQLRVPRDVDGRRTTYSLTAWDDPEVVPVVASARLARLMSLDPGQQLVLVVADAQIPVRLVGIAPLVPGSSSAPGTRASTPTGSGGSGGSSGTDSSDSAAATDVIVVDQVLLSRAIITGGRTDSTVDEWWVDVAQGRGQAYLDRVGEQAEGAGAASSEVAATQQSEGPLRIATPAALWLVVAAAVILTVAGFAVHTAAAMRSRRTEFAQLRAIGLDRRSLVLVIGVESVLLSALGTVFGIAIGVLLGAVVAPLVGLTPDGGAPEPSVAVIVPVGIIAGLVVLVAIIVVSVVVAVAGRQRSADPAAILRGAGE